VDAAGGRLALTASFKNTCFGICKAIIEQHPRALPTGHDAEPDSDDDLANMCCDYLKEAYDRIGRKRCAARAVQLLMPHFRNPEFRDAFKDIFDSEVWERADDHFPLMDLILDVQEFSRSVRPEPDVDTTFSDKSKLLDFIVRRKQYLPIAAGGSFYFFERRIDFGPSLRSYREATRQLLPKDIRSRMEMKRVLLDLVECAAKYLLS
jgi:hypothetical protein